MQNEFTLKYGFNPHQIPAKLYMKSGNLPLEILNGRPGYINFLDAFHAWQLVKELKQASGHPAATSFKHVSPAGAAIGTPIDEKLAKMFFISEMQLSPLAAAYVKARGADRCSSFGDFIALSDKVDVCTATIISKEVSDGIIAPDYDPQALEILKQKRKGSYNIIKIDPHYTPPEMESRDVFGISFSQKRNDAVISTELFDNIVTTAKEIPPQSKYDLLIALITLKYTQSNSICYAYAGQAIGIGAGQQSRIHCTRLAGTKADNWFLRQHSAVLSLPFKDGISRADRDNAIDQYLLDENADSTGTLFSNNAWEASFTAKPKVLSREERKAYLADISGVALGSDAFFPFGDNIERAHQSGVSYIAQPGGSIRDDHVIETCNKYGIAMACTQLRLFHH